VFITSAKGIDHYYVLGQIVEAVNMLSKAPKAYALLPEVRSNLIMATSNAVNIEDIAGIPGRLTEVFGNITAPAYPNWAASRNTARILLAFRKYSPDCRAMMEIKYNQAILETVKTLIPNTVALDFDGGPLDQILGRLFKNSNKPEVLYTTGGMAREGAIIITGSTAVEVAKKVITISEKL
jgi:predicted fused transcriptional regulator/phosphomethylpyrimidine kinase